MNYRDFETSGRRLVTLRILSRSNDYTTNEFRLKEELGTEYGHKVSSDVLHTDLAWLDEQGLVVAQQTSACWIATLTSRGDDVASGRAQVPGVARPKPGV